MSAAFYSFDVVYMGFVQIVSCFSGIISVFHWFGFGVLAVPVVSFQCFRL